MDTSSTVLWRRSQGYRVPLGGPPTVREPGSSRTPPSLSSLLKVLVRRHHSLYSQKWSRPRYLSGIPNYCPFCFHLYCGSRAWTVFPDNSEILPLGRWWMDIQEEGNRRGCFSVDGWRRGSIFFENIVYQSCYERFVRYPYRTCKRKKTSLRTQRVQKKLDHPSTWF